MKGALYFTTFVAGTATGALGMYLYSKKKYDKRIKEEIASIKKSFKNALRKGKEPGEKQPEFKWIWTNTGTGDTVDIPGNYSEAPLPLNAGHTTSVDLDSKIKEFEQIKNDILKQCAYASKTKPKLISADSFANNDDDYEKITLYYFQNEDLVVDDRYEPVDDWENVVGYEFKNVYVLGLNVAYVRNDILKGNYEILLEKTPYEEYVKGDEYLTYLNNIKYNHDMDEDLEE